MSSVSISTQAYDFFDYRTIYNAPENDDFRQERPNPNIIFPGDQLYIPDKGTITESRSTGAAYQFRIQRQKVMLRIVLKRGDLTA